MFKVECLGCQAPYQVDERRIPEKGLKMRCPKCGTSFKVEPPSPPPGAMPAPLDAPETVAEPAPAAPFTTANVPTIARGAASKVGGREVLARTMIGVAGAQAAQAGDAGQVRGFKVPRPGGVAARGDWAALSVGDTVVVAGTEPPPDPGELEFGSLDENAPEDAELPAVVDVPRRMEKPPLDPAVSASSGSSGAWLAAEPISDSPPESLAEPSSPLSLSELPQPVAAPRPAVAAPPAPASSADAPSLELDYGPGDLPVAAVPRVPRKPPPRRARAPEAPAPAASEGGLDLPARLEDLERRARPPTPPRAKPERAPAAAKPSSLDDVGLPAVVMPKPARPPVTELSEPLTASGLELDEPDLPALGAVRAAPAPAPRAPQPLHDDLPDVFRAGPAFSSADLPEMSQAGLPDVQRAGLPDVQRAGLPDVHRAGLPAVSGQDLPQLAGASLPDVLSAGLPAVQSAGLPDVLSAGLPDVASAGLPDVLSAGLPVAQSAGLPDVLAAGLPTVTAPGLPVAREAGLPEVSAQGRGFGRVDLPSAREAGLPEVRGGLEIDLPGVGESLPAVVGDELNLPLVGETLPTAKGARRTNSVDDLSSAFGPETDDGDPFGSEADFGGESHRDPFSADGEGAPAAVRRSAETGSYGEVEIAGDDSGEAPLETADDMEFRAIPQRSTTPPARAAASADVHADSSDTEAAGSTLELGPKRPSRPGKRRWLVASAACATMIAGGALALKPAVGPFGIHFILDQVHRPEHERRLAELIETARASAALDTFRATEQALRKLEDARRDVPRFEPLAERSAYAHYAAARRFGPLPQFEATAKAALDSVDPESESAGLRLARAARDAVEKPNDAKAALEGVGTEEARELLGELLLERGDWEGARKLWSTLLEGAPKGARAAFGLARAEFGAKNIERALALTKQVLEQSPEHVGAHILQLDAERWQVSAGTKAAGAGTEALVAKVMAALPQAGPGEAALAHAVLGELHMGQGRSAPAQQAFEEALTLSRNLPRALIGLGETLHLAGRHGEALARFKAAVQVDPSSFKAQLGIAKSEILLGHLPEAKNALKALEAKHKNHSELIYWSARAEQAAGAHDAALSAYRASIQAADGRPESVDAYLGLAKLQAELGQLAAAQQTLSEARQKLPPSGALHKALGEIAMSRGQYGEAHDHFDKALELDTGDTRARFLGAVALARLGRFDEAMAAFQRVGETDKDFPGLAVERGRLFEDSGKIAEALTEYEAALAASPDDVELQGRVGCSRVVAGKARDALELLEKVAKALPRSAEVSYCLGRGYLEVERHLDAIVRLERAVNLEPTRAVYQLYVGWAANEIGRNGDAEAALGQALALDKGLADAYWQRGRLLLKQGAVKDALRDLQRALELKPGRHEALADLAVAQADLGRTGQAAKAWEDALAQDPDNATWHFRYGKLLSSMGKGQEAAAHLRRAIDIVAEAQSALPSDQNQPPLWIWQAHYLLARELGMVGAAVMHWQAYMRLSPKDDPYRREAEQALAALGQPWQER